MSDPCFGTDRSVQSTGGTSEPMTLPGPARRTDVDRPTPWGRDERRAVSPPGAGASPTPRRTMT